MLDLIDLLNENFDVYVETLDPGYYEIIFENSPRDHTDHTHVNLAQLRTLRNNMQRVISLLSTHIP